MNTIIKSNIYNKFFIDIIQNFNDVSFNISQKKFNNLYNEEIINNINVNNGNFYYAKLLWKIILLLYL